MKYTREYFEDKVVVVRNLSQFQEILNDLAISKLEIAMEYPSIVYQGLHKSIDISGITEENLLKLKYDPDFSRTVIEIN